MADNAQDGPIPAVEDEALSQSSVSSQRSSRSGSVRGPYRSYKPPNTFARCNAVTSVAGGEETYSRSFISTGNGFAPWNVYGITSPRPAGHLQQGVSIGDVGLIDPDGDFAYMFNIFLPPDDPLQERGVPEGFEPLPLDLVSSVKTKPAHFPSRTILCSKGINVVRVSEDPFEFKISTTAREGAILVLPDGASRQDLDPPAELKPYLEKYALSWYSYMYKKAPTAASMIPNGSLYLITGCDKATSYSTVSIPSSHIIPGDKVEMEYKDKRWKRTNMAHLRLRDKDEEGGKTFAVFLRGMRIGLSDHVWTRHLPYEPPEGTAYYQSLTTPIVGIRSRFVRLKEKHFGKSTLNLYDRQKVPFHPSIIILQILLEECPKTDVAIVDDSIWCSVVNKTADGTLPQLLTLVARAVASCDIVMIGRTATLVPKQSKEKSGTSAGRKDRPVDAKAYKKYLAQAKKIVKLP
ncbi:hypothetical protein CPC08DRAFT_105050 [Agrocybe pediades]|nr:hypothetical protein CPC08DRAFT_105050 [Agrocybe pediades]